MPKRPRDDGNFDECNLSVEMTNILQRNGITHFFDIQKMVLPLLQRRRSPQLLFNGGFDFIKCRYDETKVTSPKLATSDLLVTAPTGSGKTLCYVVPIVESLLKCKIPKLQCLVVLPTRELVHQVYSVFVSFTQNTRIKVASLTGTTSFFQEQQRIYQQTSLGQPLGPPKVDVIVCTPGRLVDHLRESLSSKLDYLRWLVIDEADRLLAQDYDDGLKLLLESIKPRSFRKIEPRVQKLLFSATLNQHPAKVHHLELNNPKIVRLGSSSQSGKLEVEVASALFALPTTLCEEYVLQDVPGEKPLLLLYLFQTMREARKGCLVFLHSLDAAQKLALVMKSALSSAPYTVEFFGSNLNSHQRGDLLKDFAEGKIDALITTDVLTRGIDVDNIECVINYDIPTNAKSYVHRVGRTARANRSGLAITILAPTQTKYFRRMCKEMERPLDKKLTARAVDRNSEVFNKCKATMCAALNSYQ